MKLVLVESPNKIKKISSILGTGYLVMASVGHIVEIKNTGIYNLGIDVKSNFDITWEIKSDKKKVVKELKNAVKSASTVYLASDSDREGELIAYSLKKFLNIPDSKTQRITFDAITSDAIKTAIKNPRNIDMQIVNSALARMSLDKIIGYRLSPLVLHKLGCKSAGRVQSAGLKIICDKEREIDNFKPKTFYKIRLDFIKNKKLYSAYYKGTDAKKIVTINKKEIAEKIISECKSGEYIVKKIQNKERVIKNKKPFTTSTFQQDCSAKLNYSPKKAMQIAQKLFEAGYITYIRTDAVRFSKEFIDETKKYIEDNYTKKYYKTLIISGEDNKGAQNAHESIHPTHINDTPEILKYKLSAEQYKVYNLIFNRSLAALMKDAIVIDTETTIYNNKHKFSLIAHKIKFDGFLKVYDYKSKDLEENQLLLPTFKINENIKDKELLLETKETTPPARYTEANLIKKLEESGVGRPSTFATIINILKDEKRNYAIKVGKTLKPTDKGMKLSEYLDNKFSSVISLSYTSEMENILDKIAEGDKNRIEELHKFYDTFAPLVNLAQKEKGEKKMHEPLEKVGRKCPDCGADLVYRNGRYGKFISCSNFPKCHHTEKIINPNDPVTVKAPVEHTEYKCPKCGSDIVVRYNKKTGEKFYACEKFKCHSVWSEKKFEETFVNKK